MCASNSSIESVFEHVKSKTHNRKTNSLNLLG